MSEDWTSDRRVGVILARLTECRSHSDEPVYREPDLRAAAPYVIDLSSGLLLVDDTKDHWIEIALMDFVSGPATIDGHEVDPAFYARLMHGNGAGTPLRELRHTFWGDTGYIFYPNRKLIVEALDALSRWFDLS